MFNKLFDLSIDIKKRMLAVLAAAGFVSNTLGFTVNIAVYGVNAVTIACGICAVIIGLAGILGLKAQKAKYSVGLILGLINIFEFPMLYFAYGMATFPYMLLGLYSIVLFCDEKKRGVLFALGMIYDGAIIGARFAFGDYITQYDDSAYFGSGLSAFLILKCSPFVRQCGIIKIYRN